MIGINVPTDTLPDVPEAELVRDKPKPARAKQQGTILPLHYRTNLLVSTYLHPRLRQVTSQNLNLVMLSKEILVTV